MVKGKPLEVAANIRQYQQGGIVLYDKILAVPMNARVPNLTHVYGFEKVHEIMIVMLGAFNNALNLIRPMSDEQVVQCAYDLVMTTEEDQLSIEDFALFFKGAKEGKYGRILDRLDQQTVFSLLEEYREQRHQAFQRIREEKHVEFKGLGPSERTVQKNDLAEGMANVMGRIGYLKEKLKEQKEINRASRL